MSSPRSSRSSRAEAPARRGLTLVGGRVRLSKVRTAQARIAVGFYDREDVRERVLDAVLRELSARR